MNLNHYSRLDGYTIVASAFETIHESVTDEIPGDFIWVIYHNDSTHLFVARLSVNSGALQPYNNWRYTNNVDYVLAFAAAMAILYERATGRDFSSAAPRV